MKENLNIVIGVKNNKNPPGLALSKKNPLGDQCAEKKHSKFLRVNG
jgi:hypothetical protein